MPAQQMTRSFGADLGSGARARRHAPLGEASGAGIVENRGSRMEGMPGTEENGRGVRCGKSRAKHDYRLRESEALGKLDLYFDKSVGVSKRQSIDSQLSDGRGERHL